MWVRAEMTGDAPNMMALATWTRRHRQEGADTRKRITFLLRADQMIQQLVLAGEPSPRD